MNERSYAVGYIFICLAVAVGAIFSNSNMVIVAALALPLLFGIICRTRTRYYFFLLGCFFVLDQMSFSVGGSTFKVYFILSICIILLSVYYWTAIFESKVLTMLTVWLAFGFVICFCNGGGQAAARTFLGVILQALTAYAIYFLLLSNTISISDLEKFLYGIICICLIFGIVQYIVYKVTGVTISVNTSSAAVQLAVGQIPSFRYEGNAFGKIVGWGIIFSLPAVIRGKGTYAKKYRNLFILAAVVMLISITRAAVYALVITVVAMLLWYQIKGFGGRLLKWILGLLILLMLFMLLLNSGVISLGGYSLYKLQNVFLSMAEANADGSAGFRLESMRQGLAVWTESVKNFVVGVGYGQAKGDLSFRGGLSDADVGGCELIIIAESFGIIGLLIYIGIFIIIVTKALRVMKYQLIHTKYSIWIERMVFAGIYSIIIQVLSGYMLCPEFWMIFGVFGFLEYVGKYRQEECKEDLYT